MAGGLPEGSRDLIGARQRVRDSIGVLADEAQAAGVTLAIEPLHPMYASDRCVVSTLGQALDIAADFGPSVVGVAVDTFHIWWDPDVVGQVERAGREGRIATYQVCDWRTPLAADVLLSRHQPGDGVIDFEPVSLAVMASGYDRDIEVEIFNEEIWAADASETVRRTVEAFGGGMVSAYHRRPLVGARDVEALGLAKLASGSVWQGWYMYADGRNPRRSLQESHATGSPNDFMELGYDFGAALTLDAVPSETWYRLRRQHLFLAEWGPQMAVMPAALPDDAAEPHDLSRLRWSVRSDGQRGFLFVVNHQPSAALPSHDDVTFQVELEEGAVTFPSLCVPGGAVFVFPFNLQVGGVELTWLTAQPLSILEWRGLPLLAASAIDGIPAGFSTSVAATPLRIEGPGQWWCLEAGGEPQARVVILSDEEGLRLGAGLELAEQGFLRSAPEPVRVTELTWTQVAPAEAAPPPTSAPNGRASVPTDWSGAAQFDLELPEGDGTLSLEWVGDIARAWDGQRLVSDAIHNGRAWRISAPERAGASRLRLEILPLHREAAVHVGAGRPVGADVVSARIEPRQRPVWGLGNPT